MTTKERRITSSRRNSLKNNLDQISRDIYELKKRYCKTCIFAEGKVCSKNRLVKDCFKKHLRDKD